MPEPSVKAILSRGLFRFIYLRSPSVPFGSVDQLADPLIQRLVSRDPYLLPSRWGFASQLSCPLAA